MLQIIDGHEFEVISEGLYRAVKPYVVSIQDWMFEENHINYEAITKTTFSNEEATILYVSTGLGYHELQETFERLRLTDKNIGYIGCPQTSLNSVGGLEIC